MRRRVHRWGRENSRRALRPPLEDERRVRDDSSARLCESMGRDVGTVAALNVRLFVRLLRMGDGAMVTLAEM